MEKTFSYMQPSTLLHFHALLRNLEVAAIWFVAPNLFRRHNHIELDLQSFRGRCKEVIIHIRDDR